VRQFFQAAGKEEQTVSKQDYLRQRQKLNPEVFKILNQEYLQQFYGGTEAEGWHGYIVLAVDGSRAEIPNSMENRENYGESENQYGKAVARANISTAYDVYNRFILNIEIDNYRSGEIPEGKEHLGWVKAITGERPVLFIYDRNYVSVEFIDYLEKMGDQYDLIILDPPAFAKHRNVLRNALQGYRKLNALAIGKIKPGGIIFTFSCSQVVSRSDFRLAVFSAAAQSGRHVRILMGPGNCRSSTGSAGR